MDTADLYDWEIKEIGVVLNGLARDWQRKRNTKTNLQEFAKQAHERFLKAGFIVNVVWENTLLMVPDVSAPGGIKPLPIDIEVIGRAPGAKGADDAVDGFDHERKRHEVLQANTRNERFYGEKESNRG